MRCQHRLLVLDLVRTHLTLSSCTIGDVPEHLPLLLRALRSGMWTSECFGKWRRLCGQPSAAELTLTIIKPRLGSRMRTRAVRRANRNSKACKHIYMPPGVKTSV